MMPIICSDSSVSVTGAPNVHSKFRDVVPSLYRFTCNIGPYLSVWCLFLLKYRLSLSSGYFSSSLLPVSTKIPPSVSKFGIVTLVLTSPYRSVSSSPSLYFSIYTSCSSSTCVANTLVPSAIFLLSIAVADSWEFLDSSSTTSSPGVNFLFPVSTPGIFVANSGCGISYSLNIPVYYVEPSFYQSKGYLFILSISDLFPCFYLFDFFNQSLTF